MKGLKNESSNPVFNKRGNAISDILILILVLFVFGYMTLQGNFIIDDMNDEIQNDTEMSSFAKNISSDLTARYPETMDDNFMTIFFLLWIFGVVASFLVDTNPIFYALSIIMLICVFITLIILANVYYEITAEDEDLADLVTRYDFMTFVMNHFYQTMIVVAFTILVPLFMKMKNG